MNKFQSFKKWLNEQKTEQTYGCIMLNTKIPDWKENHISGIDPKDVYIKQYDDSYGLEQIPHITILYGIHEDEIDPEVIIDVIKAKMKPVTVTITNISIFEADEYDVVKYDIPATKQLLGYREMLERTFPNTQTFPEYHPHMTLAYVKPGTGKKYVSKLDEPFDVTFDKAVYSWHEKNKDGEVEQIRKEYSFPKPEKEVDLEDLI